MARFCVRMFYILVLCPVLLASAVLTLTIDSQLGTSVEDCFDRISIGEQLPRDAIYRNVTELTTIECEQICKQDKQCQAYDYGVGAKGNATCDLSNVDEKKIKETNLFLRNPDYDVYVRRFQCEQSPPSPIDQQNSSENENQHRPVFRPVEDDPKRPLYDDLNPYETSRPSYISNRPNRPSYGGDERPDEYNPGKPDNDRPPSYGAHKPQEIPYRPDDRPPSYGLHKPQVIPYRPDDRPPSYGAHRPQEIPYRPDDRPPSYGAHKPQEIPYRPDDRPPSYGEHKPQDIPYKPPRPYMNTSRPSDSYDQLYFQDPYGKPRPEFWRPDPYHPPLPGDEIQDIYGPKPVRPLRPEYVPERPQYQYIIRPNKRPYKPVLEDQGYNQVKPLYPNRPEYGSGINDPDRPYRPSRPYDKPSYTYTGQYASNYGTSQDNSIKVEIYDPPRPYRPSTSQRPYHESPENGEIYGQGYGYNSYSNQQSFSQSAAQYGSSSWSQNNQGYKPQKPSYGTVSYEDNENDDAGYGPKPPKPKPSLSSGSYGNQHDQSGYGESSSNQGYGGQTTSNNGYGGETSLNNQGYGHNSYGGQASSNNQGYGQSSYGSQPSSNSGYGGQTSSVNGYGGQSSSTDSYASQISSTNSYGGQSSSNNGYESQSSSNNGYGGQSDSNNGYGGESSLSNGYGSESSSKNEVHGQNSYSSQSSHGGMINQHESQSNQYGTSQSGYDNQGSSSPSGYGNKISSSPFSNQYGNQQSNFYSDDESGYRNKASNSNVNKQTSQYGPNSEKGYNNQIQHNYGDRYAYNQNDYYGSHLGYGIHHLYGIKPGSYGKDPNQQYRPIITNKGPYGENKLSVYRSEDIRPNKSDLNPPGYRNDVKDSKDQKRNKPDHVSSRLDVKPVYEPEPGKLNGERVTSRPVAVGGSRNPKPGETYERKWLY